MVVVGVKPPTTTIVVHEEFIRSVHVQQRSIRKIKVDEIWLCELGSCDSHCRWLVFCGLLVVPDHS